MRYKINYGKKILEVAREVSSRMIILLSNSSKSSSDLQYKRPYDSV